MGKISSYREQDESNLRRVARRISRRDRDDDGDVVARNARSRDAARHHRRSSFGFHFAGSVSVAHGQNRRLQSSQATRRWIDNCRPTFGRRHWWRDFRSARATPASPRLRRASNPTHVSAIWTMSIFVVLPVIVFAIALWPVLGTSYIGFPIAGRAIGHARLAFTLCVFLFERTLVTGFRFF